MSTQNESWWDSIVDFFIEGFRALGSGSAALVKGGVKAAIYTILFAIGFFAYAGWVHLLDAPGKYLVIALLAFIVEYLVLGILVVDSREKGRHALVTFSVLATIILIFTTVSVRFPHLMNGVHQAAQSIDTAAGDKLAGVHAPRATACDQETVKNGKPAFFNAKSGEAQIWVLQTQNGWKCFDAPGFDEMTGQTLIKVTSDIIKDIAEQEAPELPTTAIAKNQLPAPTPTVESTPDPRVKKLQEQLEQERRLNAKLRDASPRPAQINPRQSFEYPARAPAQRLASFYSIPAGTSILIVTTQELDLADYQSGEPFTASLQSSLSDREAILAQSQAIVQGRVASIAQTEDQKYRITLQITAIQNPNGKYTAANGEMVLVMPPAKRNKLKKILGGAGVGALLGGIIHGKKGAAIGAAAGAAAGTALVVLKKGELVIQPGEQLAFTLKEPWRVQTDLLALNSP